MWTLIGVDDEVADRYALDPDMEVVTPEQADNHLEEWRKYRGDPADQVTDPLRSQAISAK